MMYLNELLSIPTLQELTLINQNACLDRPVATIESTETPDVISYVPKIASLSQPPWPIRKIRKSCAS